MRPPIGSARGTVLVVDEVSTTQQQMRPFQMATITNGHGALLPQTTANMNEIKEVGSINKNNVSSGVIEINGAGDDDFVSEIFLVKVTENQTPSKVSCRWRIARSFADVDASQYFHSLDLLLSTLPTPTLKNEAEKRFHITDATNTPLGNLIRRIEGLDSKTQVAAKVVLAPRDGYVCMSDIVDMRMRHSDFVDAVVSLSTWGTYLPGFSPRDRSTLLTALQSSPGAIIAKQSQSSYEKDLRLLQRDLEMRLSLNWLLPTKPVARTVAVVDGHPMREPKRGIYWSQGFFDAARALGISIIVIDEPGHWLEGEEYAHLRDDFIAMDMSSVEELPRKMVKALKDRHIDGIVTFTDRFVIATAEAAELMGLPTESSQAMRQAHFKHDMRKLVNKGNIQAIYLDHVKQLDDPAMAEEFRSLKYPLIVKPTRGGSSKGVKKVTDNSTMRQAVRAVEDDGLAQHGILIETYVDGPELDANFVLWDGEVTFLEVTDNFPCLGDVNGSTEQSIGANDASINFAETVLISNSGLPPEEVEVIRSSLQRDLLQLGFRSGVYHSEARMLTSSMRYEDVQGDGILDLVRNTNDDGTDRSGRKPDVFLIEVNARPPGTGGTWTALFTYGVNMGALHLLRAIDDAERFKALSKPFSFTTADPGDGGGAQYWTAHSMIPVHRENILVPEDFFERVYQILPEIVPYVSRAELYAQPGKRISPSWGGVGWIGYFLLYSRVSRRHAVEMYYRAVEASRKVLDDVSGFDA